MLNRQLRLLQLVFGPSSTVTSTRVLRQLRPASSNVPDNAFLIATIEREGYEREEGLEAARN
jgi:hypothetical protein